jgi:hypothetical protein
VQQKYSLTDKSSLLNKGDEKKQTFTISRRNEDLVGNINSFREDLRKQITEKLRTSSRIIDVSSPKSSDTLKGLFSSRAGDNFSQTDFFKKQTSTLTTKASEKRFDLGGDLFNRKKGDTNLLTRTAQKTTDNINDLWEKKRDSRISIRNLDTNSFFTLDSEKKSTSPFKD